MEYCEKNKIWWSIYLIFHSFMSSMNDLENNFKYLKRMLENLSYPRGCYDIVSRNFNNYWSLRIWKTFKIVVMFIIQAIVTNRSYR